MDLSETRAQVDVPPMHLTLSRILGPSLSLLTIVKRQYSVYSTAEGKPPVHDTAYPAKGSDPKGNEPKKLSV